MLSYVSLIKNLFLYTLDCPSEFQVKYCFIFCHRFGSLNGYLVIIKHLKPLLNFANELVLAFRLCTNCLI